MRLTVMIISLLAMTALQVIAQNIEYTYDAAGNREARKIVTVPAAPAVTTTGTGENNTQETEPIVYEELLGEKQLKIYPNPTQGKLSIEITNYNLNEKGSIQVFDMSGRLVQNVTQLENRMEIDITNEPSGSYIMIMAIGGKKSEWKIIKN